MTNLVFFILENLVAGVRLAEGMFFTIEPMINIGGYKVKILDDGWTAVTACDKFIVGTVLEHSIGVTNYG